MALNLSDEPVEVALVSGTIAISTARDRDDRRVDPPAALGPWEGIVLER